MICFDVTVLAAETDELMVDAAIVTAVSRGDAAVQPVANHTLVINQHPALTFVADESDSGRPDLGPVTYEHTLTNDGNYHDNTIALTWQTEPDWSVTVNGTTEQPVEVSLLQGQAMSVTVEVTIPDDATCTMSNTTLVRATSYAGLYMGQIVSDTVVDKTSVLRQYGVDFVHDETRNARSDPSQEVVISYTHRLTNTGNCMDTFDFISHSSQGFDVAVPAPVLLQPGESVTRNFYVTVPPMDTSNLLVETTVITAVRDEGWPSDGVVDTSIVNQVPGVALVPHNTAVVTQPALGADLSLSYTHTLINSGNYTDTFDLTWQNEHGWDVYVDGQGEQPVAVAVGGDSLTATIQVTVAVPHDVYTLTNWTLITATSQFSPTAWATAVDTTTLRRPHVTLAPDWVSSVAPGAVITRVHALSNTGGVSDSYAITYASDLGWATVIPTAVNTLPPGGAAWVTATIGVPLTGSETLSGTRDVLVITATSQLTATVYDTAVDTSTVPYAPGAILAPNYYGEGQAGDPIVYRHTLTNTGNYTETFDLTTWSEFANASVSPVRVADLGPGEAYTPVIVTVLLPTHAAAGETEQTQVIVAFAGQQIVANDYTLVTPISGVRYVAPGGTDDNNSCLAPYEYGPCATVQQGVGQAVSGDDVLVAQGVYTGVRSTGGYTSVVHVDKPIALRGGYTSDDWASSDPVARETVLDAGGQGRVLVVVGEDITPTIAGFHLRRGYVEGDGAGVYVAGAVPTVQANRIYSNTAQGGRGGGVYYEGGGAPALQRNSVYANVAQDGAGLYVAGGSPRIWNNVLYGNSAAPEGDGGGLYCSTGASLVWNNTFYDNDAGEGGGLYLAGGSPVVSNTIVVGSVNYGIYGSVGALDYNNVWGNSPADYAGGVLTGTHDFSAAPRLVDPAGGDFHLQLGSPAIDAGDPDGDLPDLDRDGNSRPLPAGGRTDVGAYESGLSSAKLVLGEPAPDAAITYTVVVSNVGDISRDVVVTDTLHPYLDYVALYTETGVGSYDPDARTVLWEGTVSPATRALITFTARITDWLMAGTWITNTAWVDHAPASVVVAEVTAVPGPRHVSTGGDDAGNNCLRTARPCRTVQYAVTQALEGDEVRVAAGTYTGIGQVVSLDKVITLTGGYNPDNWDQNPDAYTSTLSAPSGGIGVVVTEAVTEAVALAGLNVEGGDPGVAVYTATAVISRCRVHSGADGVRVWGGDLTLKRSWVYENTGDGVGVVNGTYHLVNSVIAHNDGAGLRSTQGAGRVVHDTFARNGFAGAVVGGTAGFTNTLFFSHTVGVSVTAGSTARLSNTLWHSNTANVGTYVSAPEYEGDAAFSDPDGMNYHLTIASDAIEKGVDTGLSEDIDGDLRPLLEFPDVGADEFSLSIVKHGPASADPGQLITYTLTLEGEQEDLVLTDTLDAYLSFAGTLACDVGACGYASGTVTWAGDIATGQPAHITYTAEITTWLGAGVEIVNDADVQVFGEVRSSASTRMTINGVPGTRYVAQTGASTDLDNNCLETWKPCATVQQAVDQALAGDTVDVAEGTYTGTASDVVLIAKPVSLRGGYTTDGSWTVRDPVGHPSILDGQGSRRVACIVGTVPVTMDGFYLANGFVNGDGAGLSAGAGTLTLSDSRVTNNVASGGGSGGGVYVSGGGLTVTATQVYSNQASGSGGGIYQQGGTLALYNAQVYGNAASGSGASGGGVFLQNEQAVLAGNRIYTNTATGLGGGLCISGTGRVRLERNALLDNWAGDRGGGVSVQLGSGDLITLTNNIVAANRSGVGGGGLYLWGSSQARGDLRHTTLADNGGEGVRVGDFTLAMTNTILVDHALGIVTSDSGASVTTDYTLWDATVTYTDTSGGGAISTTHDLAGSPSFMDPVLNDYHVKGDSAAVGAGIWAGVSVDLDGEGRVAPPDVGADQYPLRAFRWASPVDLLPCEVVTHTFTLTNVAGSTITGIRVTDDLPADVNYIDGVNTVVSTVGSGAYDAGQRAIVWTGDMGVGSRAYITYSANVTPYLASGTVVTFTASLSDPVSVFSVGPQAITVNTTAGAAGQEGQGAVSPEGQVTIGEPVTYTARFTVPAGHVAYRPVVVEELPRLIEGGGTVSTTPALTYVVGSLSVNGASVEEQVLSTDGGGITWTLGTVTATCGGPEVVTLAFNGRVLNLADNTAGDWLTSTLAVSYAEGSAIGMARAVSDAHVLALAEPELVFSHTAAMSENLGMDEAVLITLTVDNPGTAALHGVAVTDTLQGAWVVSGTGGTVFTDVIDTVSAGGQEAVAFVARVSDAVGPATTLTATAEARGTSVPASVPGAETYGRAYVASPVVITATTGYPDLAIRKDARPTCSPGQTIVYTIHYTNTGVVRAEGVVVTDTLPALVTDVVSATSAGATVEHVEQAIAWTLTAPVSRSLSGHVWVTASLPIWLPGPGEPTPIPVGTVLTNTAGITTTTEEPDASDNAARVVSTVQLPSLSITKTTAPPVVYTRRLLTYTLNVSNTGLGDATGLVISDTVPLSTTYRWCTGGDSCALGSGGRTVTWTQALLPAGELEPVAFTVRVDDDVVSGTTLLNWTYGVTCTQAVITPAGVVAGAPVSTTVALLRELSLEPPSRQAPILPGEAVVYTHTLTNMGNAPADVAFDVSEVPSGWTYDLQPTGPVMGMQPYGSVGITLTVGALPGTTGHAVSVITATWQGSSTFATAVDTSSVDCVPVTLEDGIAYSPDSPRIGQTVIFTATIASGTPSFNYTWDFGDGTQEGPVGVSDMVIVGSHAYGDNRAYDVELTVVNCGGTSDSVQQTVIVNPYTVCLPLALRNYP